MADLYSTVRKIMLPSAMLAAIGRRHARNGIFDCTASRLVNLCMDSLDSFNSLAVRVSGIRGYQEFLATAFNKKTAAVILFFRREYWERVCLVQNRHNIGCGDIVRLILASLLFDSGGIALPLERLSRLFVSERTEYAYNTVFTRPVAGLLRETETARLPMRREAIMRAAHCYFSAVPDALPLPIPEERYRIDSGTTGWSRQTVSGSREMKAFLHGLKQSTGASLATVIAHTTYSFLQKLREAAPDEA
jgi:hypothetical protein